MSPNKYKIDLIIFITILFILLLESNYYGQTTNWVSKGIGAGGGLFVPSVSPHNNSEYFVPTDMGALFHTVSNGSSWETIHFNQNVPLINTSVQFTSDPDILYAISGWGSSVAVKSVDGGNTWNALTTDPTGQEAFYIFADDSENDRLIVSNYFNIYFSNNGGNSFTQIYSTIDDSGIHIGGVYWDGSIILIATNFGVLESTDNGSNFAINSNMVLPANEGISTLTGSKQNGVTRLYCVTVNKNDIYGGMSGAEFYSYEGVYKVIYGSGNNWTKISNSLSANLKFYFIATAKNNIDIAYIAGGDINTAFPIVYKTNDGGISWSENFITNNNENIYTGWSGYQGDKHWWYGEYALGLAVPSNNPDVVVMTDLGFIHSTTDGGATWYQNYVNTSEQNLPNQPTPKGKSYHGIGIENTSVWWLTWMNESEIFASFTDITGIKSGDGGESWNMDYTGLNINSVYMVLKNSNTQKLYAATSSIHDLYQETRLEDNPIDSGTGDIRVSSDNGKTWQILYDFGKPVVWIAFDPNNPNIMYASVVNSSIGGIYKCDNIVTNPANWVKLSDPPRTEGHPFNIKVLNDGSLVVTYSGRISSNFTASSGVFISNDDGVSWLDRSHDDMKYWTKDIIIDPNDNSQNTWYVCVNSGWGGQANDLGGLYKTTDRGITWQNILDLYRVESCAINPNKFDEMVVTTYDEGLWSTQSLHSTSIEFSQVNSYPFFHPLRVFFDPYDQGKVWVTSFGNGLRKGNSSLLSEVLLQTKIFLEGAYNSVNDEMNVNLNNDIPLTSPYLKDLRTVDSIPQNIVDWVLIELRTGTDSSTTVISKSAFLHKDGRIVADDGTTGEIKLNATDGSYYIVIKHRNHLSVMSKNPVVLNKSTSTLYDFTTGSEKYYGNGGAKQLN